jgi:transcriptional regulator with XRE-family HTH domain
LVKPKELIKLVRDNLRAAIDADAERRPDGLPLTHAEIALKAGVGKGSIGRIYRGEVGAGIDTLEAIAGVFGLQAWQLLVGPLDTQARPEVMTPETRQELAELRRMRALLEATLSERRSDAAGLRVGGSINRQGGNYDAEGENWPDGT